MTVRTLKAPPLGEFVPFVIVPPAEETQEKFAKRIAHDPTLTTTSVPSGTRLPAESRIPANVIFAVPPLRATVVGPEAVVDVVPCSLISAYPISVLCSRLPLWLAGRTCTVAMVVAPGFAKRPVAEYVARTSPPLTVNSL